MIKFTGGRTHKNNNDCWVDALSYALDLSYEDAFEKLKEYRNKEGTIPMDLFGAVLRAKGFQTIDVGDELMTVKKVVKYFDSENNKLLIFANSFDEDDGLSEDDLQNGHVVYVKNKIVYDFENENFQNHIVFIVYIK